MTEPIPTENPGETNAFAFKAETRQLLHILIHSLYKDRDVFLRELLSNASDALNRIRFVKLTEQNVLDPDAELCVRILGGQRRPADYHPGYRYRHDPRGNHENLGTIAQSGARKFLEAAKTQRMRPN